MAFFSKFFKKDHGHYLTRAQKHLAAERYADARIDFQEALSLCPAEAAGDVAQIRAGLSQAVNRLAELNLREAEHCISAGDAEKAWDHFTLARDLADDPKLKEKAAQGLKGLREPVSTPSIVASAPPSKHHGGSSCGSCKDAGSHGHAQEEIPESTLSEADRYFLMVQPLPGELSGRYAAMGDKFSRAYLLIHDGNDAEAFPILKEMLLSCENDIVIYEVALIMYRAGQVHECEEMLKRSLLINPTNSMSYLALVHLTAEAGRAAEAMDLLHRMLELDIMADQAQFMLGELHEATGDQAKAMEAWTLALEIPTVAKPAAERLVPILAAQGRNDEAKYLTKRYLKGCC